MSVLEIESAVRQLSPKELRKFSVWFAEFQADAWDRQIEHDIKTGKLDKHAKQADKDFKAGRCTPL